MTAEDLLKVDGSCPSAGDGARAFRHVLNELAARSVTNDLNELYRSVPSLQDTRRAELKLNSDATWCQHAELNASLYSYDRRKFGS